MDPIFCRYKIAPFTGGYGKAAERWLKDAEDGIEGAVTRAVAMSSHHQADTAAVNMLYFVKKKKTFPGSRYECIMDEVDTIIRTPTGSLLLEKHVSTNPLTY